MREGQERDRHICAYLKHKLQPPGAFKGIKEAVDGSFIGFIFEPGGESVAPGGDNGDGVGDEGGLVGEEGVKCCPEHAPFWIEGDGVAEQRAELGCCGGEGSVGEGDLVADILADACGANSGVGG